jgi:hypothetical protein
VIQLVADYHRRDPAFVAVAERVAPVQSGSRKDSSWSSPVAGERSINGPREAEVPANRRGLPRWS